MVTIIVAAAEDELCQVDDEPDDNFKNVDCSNYAIAFTVFAGN